MDAYYRKDNRRALANDVREQFASRAGIAVVDGFSELVDLGDAIAGGEIIAGFMEAGDWREWYLPLSAKQGLKWKTAPVPESNLQKVGFILSIGFGNGSPLPQPSGQWDIYINERLAVSIRVVKHSQLWIQGECSLAFAANRIEAAEPYGSLCLSSALAAESFAAFGPALLTVPAEWVKSLTPATIHVEGTSKVPSTRWFQLAVAPGIMQHADVYRLLDLLCEEKYSKIGGYRMFFGDIHTHSGQVGKVLDQNACGERTWEENYLYARGPGGLDFYALTDHDSQLPSDSWEDYLALAEHFNDEGCFVCLPGYEFTSMLYGHRNIYFNGPGGAIVSAMRKSGIDWFGAFDVANAVTPAELWQALEQNGQRFLSIPHHTSATSHPFNLALCHPQHDRLIEIYSSWGSSEYYGDFPRGASDRYHTLDARDALRRGLRLGFIASSDGHDGHPGDAQSPLIKHHHLFHHLGSGLAAVLCKELTRDQVFDALYQRRCYATTGVPIQLWFAINDQVMGSVLPAFTGSKKPVLQIACRGTNGLDHIRIIKNGRNAASIPYHGEFTAELEWEDADYRPEKACYYYIRVVQRDLESAWSSPIWIRSD